MAYASSRRSSEEVAKIKEEEKRAKIEKGKEIQRKALEKIEKDEKQRAEKSRLRAQQLRKMRYYHVKWNHMGLSRLNAMYRAGKCPGGCWVRDLSQLQCPCTAGKMNAPSRSRKRRRVPRKVLSYFQVDIYAPGEETSPNRDGFKFILGMICRSSGWCFLFPMKGKTAPEIKRGFDALDREINRIGPWVEEKHGYFPKVCEMGMDVDGRSPEMKSFLEELKQLEFKGYEYESADASFDLLLRRFLRGEEEAFKVLRYHVGVGNDTEKEDAISEATVKLKIGEETRHTVAEGNGPVSALDHALRKALVEDFPTIAEVRLVDFKVRILESNLGTDAITRVHVESTDGDQTWGTVGVSDNVITASWEALIDSVSYKILLGTESD